MQARLGPAMSLWSLVQAVAGVHAGKVLVCGSKLSGPSVHRARTTKRDGEGLLDAPSKPLTLRKQGICGEVESGVIEHFLLLNWPKRSGSPKSKRGRMERRFDLTPVTRRQRTPLSWLEVSYNPASDNIQTITESCRALSCIYNPCISLSVYR